MLALFLALSASGTASGADWAANYNGGTAGASAHTQSTAVDAAGNVYLAGYFSGLTYQLGSVTLTGIGITGTLSGANDAFVVKLDASGAVLWAKNFGGIGADTYGQSIAVDSSGNVYLGGYFRYENLTTPALTLIGGDVFAIKLDSTGVVVWSKNFGGSGAVAYGQSIAVDSSGNVYLGGYFSGNFTAPAVTKIGSQDAFAIKLDSTGTVIWAKNFGGSGASAYGRSIAVDGSGNVYLGGDFVNANLTTPALTKVAMGNFDAFAIKLSSLGAVTWAKNFGGNGAYAYGRSIAVDGSGNVYLGGDFTGNLTTPALTLIGMNDAFAIKLSSTGVVTWAKNFGGNGARADTYCQSIAVDSSGNVYLGGYFDRVNLSTPVVTKIGTYDAFAIKLSSTGTVTWAKNFGGSGAYAYGNGIAVDGAGNVYLGGYFYFADLTTPALTKINLDAFAIKLSSTGTVTWSKNFCPRTPVGNSSIQATAVDASGNVYLAGYFINSATFTLGSTTLNKIGGAPYNDAFVAKLDPSGVVLWAKNFGGSGADTFGQSITVDSAGNVYLGGNFRYANLTTPALTVIGNQDAFAIKLDSAGAVIWAKNFGGSGAYAYGNGITVDGAGNVYLGGCFNFANLTTPALTMMTMVYQNYDAFAIKLSSTGAVTWAKNFGGSIANVYGRSIAVDGSGNVYLEGYFQGNLTTPALTSMGQDVFAIKLDSAGAVTWAKNFGGSEAGAYGNSMAVDGIGNVYLAGYFSGNLTTPALTMIGAQDAFAIKLDSAGAVTWAKNFGGSGAGVYSNGIAVDGTGNVYLGGYFENANLTTPALTKIGTNDDFAIKLDSSGSSLWTKNFGGSGKFTYGYGIAADDVGNVYLGGYLKSYSAAIPASDAYLIHASAYTLTFNASSHGSISGTSVQTMSYSGSGSAMTAVPDPNSHFVNWTGTNGFVTTSVNPLTVANVTSSMTITANFVHDPVNGVCGSSSGQTFNTAPITNLCSAGTTTGTSGTGPWTWTCSGQYTGTDATNCAANIDITPPLTTATPGTGNYSVTQSVSLTCNDGAGSGCLNKYYCTGSGCSPTTLYSGVISIATFTVLRFYSTDAAGNSEAINEETFTIMDPIIDAGFDSNANNSVYSMIVQTDGRILSGGSFTIIGGTTRNYMARLNADGSLDATFNPMANNAVYTTAIQEDGKILIGGPFTTVGGIIHNRMARLFPDGSLDATFNPNANGSVRVTTVLTDGGILIGGAFTTIGGTARHYMAKLNADGSLDATFNPDANNAVYSTAMQTDGKILSGGTFTTIGGTTRNNVARLNADGSLDASFDPNANGAVNSIVVQADGKIVIGGGFSTISGTPRNRMARLNADGSLDATFNPNANSTVYSLAMQADGKILCGGAFSIIGGSSRNKIARLNADGTLDASFNPNANNSVTSLAVQADGKVLLGGAFTTMGGASRNHIARLNSTDAALQDLTAVDGSTARWMRSGSGPELSRVWFESSPDMTTWTILGAGSRILGGWEITGISLPYTTYLRARGYATGGYMNGSSSMIESVTLISLSSFTLTAAKAGTGSGTVNVGFGSLVWSGSTGTALYAPNTVVSLTAVPDAGALFVGWSGDADCGDGSVTMNANTTCTGTFNDVTAPVTTAAPTSYAFGTWTNSGSVAVTQSTVDVGGSGVAASYPAYCIDTTNTCTPGTSGTVLSVICSADSICTQYVRYRSADNAGNIETIKNSQIKQDLQAPITSPSLPGGVYGTSQSVTLVCGDNSGSGCASTVYCIGAGCTPTTAYSGAIAINSTTILRYASVDAAGNSESVRIRTYTIDTTPPTLSLSTPVDESFTNSAILNVSGTASDANGIQSLVINGQSVVVQTDNTFSHIVTLSKGLNVITTVATDDAGNTTTDTRTITLTQATVCTPQPAGLTAWWRAEGNANDSIGGNTATLMSGATATAPGKVGQAFGLHGLAYVEMSPGVVLGNTFTESVWINPSSISPTDLNFYGFIGNDLGNGSATRSPSMWVYQDGIHYGFGDGTAWRAKIVYGVLTAAQWHLITTTFDGTNYRLYVNGIEKYNYTGAAGATPIATPVRWIGRVGSYFNGLIDEVQLYNRALTADEVARIYSAGSEGVCETLITLPDGAQNAPYNHSVAASNGVGPYVYNVSAGTLPAGISLDSATGGLSGTPTALGVSSFTISTTDANLYVFSQSYKLQIISGACAPTSPSGLVSWWKGDGSAIDKTGGHHGTLVSGATYAMGRVGQAFSFNGTNAYIDTGSWTPGSQWTIEAWVNPLTAPLGRHTIAGGVHDYHDWGIALENGQFGTLIRPVGTGNVWQTLVSGELAVAGTWYHVVGESDGTTARLYVNGQLKSSGAVDPSYIGTSYGTWIGGETCCAGNNFPGLIDEVKIYSRALTAQEISDIYNAGSAGQCEIVPTTTGVSAPAITYGANGTVTVTVSSTSSAPTGNVTLSVDGGTATSQVLSAVTGNSSSAIFTITKPTAGSHTLSASYAAQNGYSSSTASGTLTVNARTLTVTATGLSKVYDGATTASVNLSDNRVAGDVIVVGYASAVYSDKNVGTNKTITITGMFASGINAGNYSVSPTTTTATANITARSITISANSRTKTEGLVDPSLTYAVTSGSLASGDVITGSLSRAAGEAVGTYAIQQGTLTAGNNYEITYVGADLTITTAICASQPSGLVSWWRGEGNANDSVSRNTGTIINGATASAPGKVGQAFSFNEGNDHIIINPVNGFPVSEIAVAFWMRSSDTTNSGTPFSYAVPGLDNDFLLTGYNNFNINITDAGATGPNASTGVSTNDGNWHFIAVTWKSSSGQVKLYKDAQQVYSGTLAVGAVLTPGGSLVIGIDQDAVGGGFDPAQAFKGTIDEMMLYNRALTTDEIARIYNAGSAGVCSAIVTLPDGAQNAPYSHSVAASGGVGPYAYSVSSGTLPAGISLDSTTGVLSGLPTVLGVSSFTISAVDANLYTFLQTYKLQIETGACASSSTSGLVGWWKGDGNALDQAGGNDGTPQNGTTFVAGKVGQAFKFDGMNDYVTIKNAALVANNNASTVNAWVYPTSFGSADTIIYSENNGGTIYELRVTNQGISGFCIWRTDVAGNWKCASAASPIQLNAWSHIAGTLDASGMKLYVNGVPAGTNAANRPSDAVVVEVDLGRGANAGGMYYFNGSIDDVQIYNRALTAQEISDIYNAGSAGQCGTEIPSISGTPSSLDFGSVVKGASNVKTIYVSNSGTANLVINSMTITGAQASEFSIQNDTCSGNPVTNGHRYQAMYVPGGISWNDANSAAMAAGGNLAAITSQGINDYIFSLVRDDDRFWYSDGQFTTGPWFGGYQPDGSPEPGGGWRWVGGEPWNYTHWFTSMPDNWQGSSTNNAESKLHFYSTGSTRASTWNDTNGVWAAGYIAEFDPGCQFDVVFTPASSGAKDASLTIHSNDPNTTSLVMNLTGAGIADAVTGATLSPSIASPQMIGNNNIIFTAGGIGGSGTYEYLFWLKTSGVWNIVQNYSATNTWTWNTNGVAAGSYDVLVYVRNAGSSAPYEALSSLTYALITSLPATGATISSNLATPQVVGSSITFTADGVGGTGTYEYKFWLKANGVWTMVQNYSTVNTWTWNTTGASVGTYGVQVYVRNTESSAKYEATKTMSYVLSASPATGATLISNIASPQTAGAGVTFTAGGIGGSGNYEYKFWIKANGVWIVVQDYSTTNTYTWDTTGLIPGTYRPQVYVRNVGSTAKYEAVLGMGYVVK